MIAWVIEEEFGVQYHPGHVRKLLHAVGFSVQRPCRVLARADAAAQDKWHRRTYPDLFELCCEFMIPRTPGDVKQAFARSARETRQPSIVRSN